MSDKDGGPAMPVVGHNGMSLLDYFKGQALSNPVLCTGKAETWELQAWFGNRSGITRAEIAAKQAESYADAMLLARTPKERR